MATAERGVMCPRCCGSGTELNWDDIRRRVQDALRATDKPQREIAQMAQTSIQYVRYVKQGETSIGWPVRGPAVLRIAKVLGVSV